MPRLKTRTPRMYLDRGRAYVKLDGERVALGKWRSAEAQEAFDRLIAEYLANGRTIPAPTTEAEPVTVAEILVAYVKHAQERYDIRDMVHLTGGMKHARKLYGTEPAESFGPKRLRVVRDQMVDSGLARSTVNKRINRLRSAFKWAVSMELCSERIYRRLATVPGLRRGEGGRETDRIVPAPRADIRKVRPWLTRPVRALIDLQLLTGARADELVRLKATDLDTTGAVWTATLEHHKTAHKGKDRTLYFGPRAQHILRLFMRPGRPLDKPLFDPRESNAEAKRRDAEGSRRPDQKPNPVKGSTHWRNQHGDGLLDEARTIGEHYTTPSYRKAIHRACKAAGVDQWGPHRLRHNAATFLRRQFGIDVASVILGHSSLAITATYAELNHKRAIEVMAKVG